MLTRRLWLVTGMIWVMVLPVAAQPAITPPELMSQLEGVRNFSQIEKIVNNYINRQKQQATGPDAVLAATRLFKHWNRWFILNRNRLDSDGNILNWAAANMQVNTEMQDRPDLVQHKDGNAQWSVLGPTDRTRIGSGHNSGLGRVNCIAFHPTDASTFYIGTPAGGLWKTVDAGSNWFPLTDMLPSLGVTGIVVDRGNANRIWILTGDGFGWHTGSVGVLVSNDGGSTWAQTGVFPNVTALSYAGCKLIQHPTNRNILFAATTHGIFRTTDAGATWTRRLAGDITDIEFNPGDPTIMYAARRGSSAPFVRSTNTGVDWTSSGITGVPTNATRIAIGVSANQPNHVVFLAGPATSSGVFVGIFYSTTSGQSFTQRATAPNILGYANDGLDDRHQTTYDLAIDVNPANMNQMIFGGINLWTSNTGGTTGSLVRRTQWFDDVAGTYVHADIHNLTYNPLNNRLYVCSDGGVSSSTDHGVNWVRLWTSLTIMQFYHMTGFDNDANLLVGGTQDNGTNYRKSNTANFHHIEGGDGYSTFIDWSNSNRVILTANESIQRTDDGGNNLYEITPPGADGCWPTLVQHPSNADTIFAAYCNGVYRSHNKGAANSWVKISDNPGTTELAIARTNGRKLMMANGTDLFRSSTGGTSWTRINTATNFPNGANISDIAFDPLQSDRAIVTVGGYTQGQKVYRTNNLGDTWINISYNLPNAPATAIAMDVTGNIYVGMDVGVFVLPWAGTTWVPFYNFLPKTMITDFIINETAGVIRAATFGRGVWSTELFGACPANLTLINNQVFNQRYWQASSLITSQQVIMPTVGNDVFYSSGNAIDLKVGFYAIAGSRFNAYIAPCNNSIPQMSTLSTEYNVRLQDELIAENLTCTDTVATVTSIEVTEQSNGVLAIKIALSQPEGVFMFAERISDGEVVATVVRAPMKAGEYAFALNLQKLSGKGIALVWSIGEGKQQRMLLK